MGRWSYADLRPGVRGEILGRIAGGERLKHICAEAGMPCQESVNLWMRRDPAFAAEVRRARERADWERRLRFDPVKAEAFLARVRAGASPWKLAGGPDMPSLVTFRHWMALGGIGFGEEVRRLMAERRTAVGRRLSGRRRAFDAAIGEEIYLRLWKGEPLRAVLRSDRRYPSLMVFTRWRREDADFDRRVRFVLAHWRGRRPRRVAGRDPAEIEACVYDLMVEHGLSLRAIGRLPGMPCARTLYSWVERRPDFAKGVAVAAEWREDGYFDRMLELAGSGPALSMKAARALTAPLMRQATRLRKRPGWKRRRQWRPHPG